MENSNNILPEVLRREKSLWWQTEDMVGHVQEILSHINHTRRVTSTHKKTELCKFLFDALNKTWNAFNDYEGVCERSNTASFTQLVLKGVPRNYQDEFLRCEELRNLVELRPFIMNHNTLIKGGYRPGRKIGSNLIRRATKEHRELVNAFNDYQRNPTSDAKQEVLKKTVRLLYVVRSNIAHGEKTPYGPDLEKARRDEKVSGIVVPLLRKLLELIFDKPSQKLVVYGTLAPGGINEQLLKNISGIWLDCKIKGKIMHQRRKGMFYWISNQSTKS